MKDAHDLLKTRCVDGVSFARCAKEIEVVEMREDHAHLATEDRFDQLLFHIPRNFTRDENGLWIARHGGSLLHF